tara:strand:+ start:175 stop:1170 length:996 start_codon:yes stop_codon:yes gene_type:complete
VRYYKNYICSKLNSIEKLTIKKIAQNKLNTGQVKVLTYAIGINYVDILMIRGIYQHKKELPFIPGTEACGIIIEENCNKTCLIGKRVIINSKGGCFSEIIVTDLSNIFFPSKKLNSSQAAVFYNSALTAFVSLIETAKVKKQDTVLISGASGGVGQAMISLAKHKGLKIISLYSNNNKKQFLTELGSDIVIKNNRNAIEKIKNLTEGSGVDVILDITGVLKYYNILRTLKWGGKYVIIGFMKNNITSIPTNYILIKGIKVFGIRAGEYLKKNKDRKKSILKEIFSLSEKNVFTTKKINTFDFKHLKDGLKLLDERKVVGRIVITTDSYKDY